MVNVGNIFHGNVRAGESLSASREWVQTTERIVLGALEMYMKRAKRLEQEALQDKTLKAKIEEVMVAQTAKAVVDRYGSDIEVNGRKCDFIALDHYTIYKDRASQDISISPREDENNSIFIYDARGHNVVQNNLNETDVARFKAISVMLQEKQGFRSFEQKNQRLKSAYMGAGVSQELASEAARIKTHVDGFSHRSFEEEQTIRELREEIYPEGIGEDATTLRVVDLANELAVKYGTQISESTWAYERNGYSILKNLEDENVGIYKVDIDDEQHLVAILDNGISINDIDEIEAILFETNDNISSQEFVMNSEQDMSLSEGSALVVPIEAIRDIDLDVEP